MHKVLDCIERPIDRHWRTNLALAFREVDRQQQLSVELLAQLEQTLEHGSQVALRERVNHAPPTSSIIDDLLPVHLLQCRDPVTLRYTT